MKTLPETTAECFGLALREWRGGLSQQKAASLLGETQSSYSRWETGANLPRIDALVRAGIDVAALVERAREWSQVAGIPFCP